MTLSSAQLRVLLLAVVVGLLAVAFVFSEGRVAGAGVGRALRTVTAQQPVARDLTPYQGLGAWVDVFDYAPAYQGQGDPPVTPAAVDDMAAAGVRTLFIQAARNDPRSPEGIVDRELLAQFVVRAHRHGMRVIAWYVPRFGDVTTELGHLERLASFEALGHRVDGIALDIEFTEEVPDHAVRNQQLVDLSTKLRAASGADVLGAIVLPPVQTEVVNPSLWPDFPWPQIAGVFDVWLPMSYWTFRSDPSGYHDGYTYNEESTRRLRANLGRADAVVHGIGGIGDQLTAHDLDRFVASLVDTGAVGGSIYDWATLPPELRQHLGASFTSGPAASLAPG